uniref:Small ribosomal subunit protein uS3m n=1 Tax=Arthrobotrys musiformis TaxID=47236 RepID=A0A482EA17_9PEZI|nr:hypothetical protein [Arthrobotrys musiformis]
MFSIMLIVHFIHNGIFFDNNYILLELIISSKTYTITNYEKSQIIIDKKSYSTKANTKIFEFYSNNNIKPSNYNINDNNIEDESLLVKHRPASVREWSQSVYSYNKLELRDLMNLYMIITKWIKIYFYSIPAFARKKMYKLKKRLITHKIFISTPKLKHTSSKILITLYFFAEQKKISTYFRKKYKNKKDSIYFNMDYLFNHIDKNTYKPIIDYVKEIQYLLFKTKINSYWLDGILEKDKLQFFKANFDNLKVDWFKKSLVYYNDIINSMSIIIKAIMLRYKLKLIRLDINKLKLKFIISKWINVIIKNYPKFYINNRIIFSIMIIRIINWLFKNKREDSFELKKKEEKITKLINKIKDDLNLIKINKNKMTNILTRIIKKAKYIKKNKVKISKIINRIEKKKKIIERNNEIINETKEYIEFKINKDLINKIIREKRIESARSAERDDEIINEIKKYIEQINKYNMLFEIIKNINEILAYITEGVKDALNNSIKISGIKFFSYINSQISKASLLISFNYLVKYNFKKIYLEKLGVFTQIGRDRLYPNSQIIMSYIKKKNFEFFLFLTKYFLKKHKFESKINKLKIWLLNYLNRYSKKKIEINLIRLKYIYLNSNMLAEFIARKLITKKRSLLKAKIKIFAKAKLVRFNKYKLKDKINVFNIMGINSLRELSSLKSNNYYLYLELLSRIKYKFISGIKLIAAGRLTKRNIAARAVKAMTYKGSLKNLDSSHRSISIPAMRGDWRPNLDFTVVHNTAKTGSFAVKGWISYYS